MNRARIIFTSALLMLVLTTSDSLAGPNRWTSSGPEGPAVTQIVTDPADPATAYVATYAGVFKTSNGGQQWQAVNDGLSVNSLSALFVVPDDRATLYAAAGSAIFISTDAAQHWSARGRIEGVFVNTFAFDAATRTLYAGTTAGVFRSADGGQTWGAPHGERLSINSLGLARNGTIYAVSVIPVSGSMLSLLYRSSDHGQTWTLVNNSPANNSPRVSRVLVDIKSPAIYLTNGDVIYLSRDDAKTWIQLPSPSPNESVRGFVSADDGVIYASTEHAVFEYRDGSNVWIQVGSAISESVGALALSASSPQLVYAVTASGIVTAIVGERDWTSVNSGLPGAYTYDVGVARSESVAYAATIPGVFRTEDHGKSWQKILPNLNTTAIEVSSVENETVFVASGREVLRTIDGGSTWKKVVPDFASALAVAPSDPATVYAALSTTMSRSTDGGETWKTVMAGLPLGFYGYFFTYGPTSMSVDPADSTTVVVANGVEGAFKTTDGGANWKSLSNAPPLGALAIEHADPLIVYAAPLNRGIIESADGGITWTQIGLTDKRVLTLAVNVPHLYAGTEDGHVYRSDDHGQHWTGFDDGLSRARVSSVAIGASGNDLYVATAAGVYDYHVVNENIAIERLPDDPARLSRMLDDVVAAAEDSIALVFPVAGTATGSDGTLFTTELMLVNNRDSGQDVLVTWLPRGASSDTIRSFRASIPASGTVKIADIVQRLGIDGIGSLAVIGVSATGDLDAKASIDGSDRIWIHPADGRAPFSQSIPPARVGLFSEHGRGHAAGFREDAQFRSNLGIVNLSSDSHQFTIRINGDSAFEQLTFAVPPFSLVQTPLPDADYGSMSLDVLADTSSTRWVFYGSIIDRTTGEAQTILGTPLR